LDIAGLDYNLLKSAIKNT